MYRFRPFVFLLALLGAVLWGRSALAAPPPVAPSWATWRLDTAFFPGKVHSKWTVVVGGVDGNGAQIELVSATHAVPCLVSGPVVLGSGVADFNGGFIKCTLPDFAQAANGLILQTWGPGFELDLADVCECQPTETRRVEASLLPTGQGSNPLFHHPNLSFAVPGEGGFFANYLNASGQSSTSATAKIAGMTAVATDHLCDGGSGCKFVHYRNGQVLGVDYQSFASPAMYTGKTAVYLGYDPVGGAIYRGKMGSLHVDPGCRMD